ncbi:MAG: DUF429 domain-containing protein, partial [Halobaculum sp.]
MTDDTTLPRVNTTSSEQTNTAGSGTQEQRASRRQSDTRPRRPERVIGLDFSAAARSSGTNSWLADCRPTETGLRVDSLATVSEMLDLDSTDREEVLPALVEFFTGLSEPTVVGMDFPFALPAEFLGFEPEKPTSDDYWEEFVTDTPASWGILDDVADPKALYEQVRATAEERGFPLARETDTVNGGQNPAGYRIRTQTYYGISAVLRPLVERGDVCVPPVYENPTATLTVLETYPAAVFDRLPDGRREGYKSDDRAGIAAREWNRGALRAAGVDVEGTDATCLTASDDALDAVAAAVAAARDWAVAVDAPFSPRERVEAVVFDGFST